MCTGTHPFIPAPNVAQVELLYEMVGEKGENNLYFENAGGWDAAALEALATAVISEWTANIAPFVSSFMGLTVVKATDLTVFNGAFAQVSPSSPVLGGATGDPLPLQNAFKIKFVAGNRGPWYQGGIYHYGFVEGQTNGPRLPTLLAQGIRLGWSNLIENVEATIGCSHVIVSLCFQNAWRTTALVSTVQQVTYTDLVVDTQRRRQPRS